MLSNHPLKLSSMFLHALLCCLSHQFFLFLRIYQTFDMLGNCFFFFSHLIYLFFLIGIVISLDIILEAPGQLTSLVNCPNTFEFPKMNVLYLKCLEFLNCKRHLLVKPLKPESLRCDLMSLLVFQSNPFQVCRR